VASPTGTERRRLAVAFARGYVESPRAVTLADPGDRLDVSDVAASGALRRAQRTLLAAALGGSDDVRSPE
jgi:predicted DNA binding protein